MTDQVSLPRAVVRELVHALRLLSGLMCGPLEVEGQRDRDEGDGGDHEEGAAGAVVVGDDAEDRNGP
jgi:hypothetical protein